jgi:hypothetical protein
VAAADASSGTQTNDVEAGRRALAARGEFPWYDASRDALRRVDVEPPRDLQNRRSRWETKPPAWRMPPWLWTLLEVLGWIVLAAIIVLLAVALVRAYALDTSAQVAAAPAPTPAPAAERARIEQLPFSLQTTRTDLLGEARRCYEAGDYGQAVILLYSYQLLQLDKHRVIRLTKGKTNRQYLREARRQPRLRQLLELTMVAFEDVFFGRHALDRERFESCWNRVGDFQQLLEQVAP